MLSKFLSKDHYFMTFLMKIVLCGDSTSGKTELKERYMGRRKSNISSVTGFDSFLNEDIIDGRAIKIQIWDLYTERRFDEIRLVYYLTALGAVIIFDVTKPETFESQK